TSVFCFQLLLLNENGKVKIEHGPTLRAAPAAVLVPCKSNDFRFLISLSICSVISTGHSPSVQVTTAQPACPAVLARPSCGCYRRWIAARAPRLRGLHTYANQR